jgi:2-oxoglutarate dehydrogenase E2 component (dihydrolipoamide succinyltransferase)
MQRTIARAFYRHLQQKAAVSIARNSRSAARALSSLTLGHANPRNENTWLIQARTFATGDIVDVKVPSMGDSISEGTVIEWLKFPGDFIQVDEVVAVLETDKVSVDVRATHAGKLVKQLAGVDENVFVGAPLFQIEETDDVPAAVTASTPASSTPPPSATPSAASIPTGEAEIVPVPSMGDSISEGTIVHWSKGPGDAVAADDVVVVIETDKVSVDVRAPKPGIIQEVLAKVDDVVSIGAPLFKLLPGTAPVSSTAPVQTAAATAVPTPAPVASDKSAPPTPAKKVASSPAAFSPLSFDNERVTRREKMSRMRLRTAERLKESQNTSASLTTFQEVDMTNIMALRKKYKDDFEAKHGVKLGFMSAFIKASSSALLEVPGVNAMIDDVHKEIVYRDYVDMSVAVSTPKGLVTPVMKNTESLSFADIEKKLAELAERARAGKITLEEMTGGNFTISNGGVFGSLMGTPIINLPQSAILGMHATKMRPVVINGEVVARPMMYLALTYDHRLIDGREAVTCLKSIADKIENPERLLLDL